MRPKRKDPLDILAECLRSDAEPNIPGFLSLDLKRTRELFDIMLWYYKLYDIKTYSAHATLFSRLYMTDKPDTFDSIAYETGISYDTLNRTRKEFNDFFIKLKEAEIDRIP
jgi:hypothetical protein